MSEEEPSKLEHTSIRFIEQIRKGNRIKLVPFDEKEWFRGAYSTLQRTLRDGYKPLSSAQKESCREFCIQRLLRLKSASFDKCLEQLIKDLSSQYSISIGHSQKLLSIITKYAFAVYHGFPQKLPVKWSEFVASNKRSLPVPIDAIVLHALKTGYPDCFEDIKSSQSQNRNTGKLNSPAAYLHVKNKWQPWSRLTDYDAYFSLQDRIRFLANETNVSPLEFEMIKLWPT